MIYAFAYPLVGGTLPFLGIAVFGVKKLPCFISRNLWHCGIATLTIGSIFNGVLEIYGTTNSLSIVYTICGIPLCASAAVVCVLDFFKKRNNEQPNGK